jgi:1,6-anhydro-N-acetylmuramate kinase
VQEAARSLRQDTSALRARLGAAETRRAKVNELSDALMDMLRDAFAPIPVRTATSHGVHADAKEALCFAVLAQETVNGTPTNLPSVTGASARTLLGSVSVPGP